MGYPHILPFVLCCHHPPTQQVCYLPVGSLQYLWDSNEGVEALSIFFSAEKRDGEGDTEHAGQFYFSYYKKGGGGQSMAAPIWVLRKVVNYCEHLILLWQKETKVRICVEGVNLSLLRSKHFP